MPLNLVPLSRQELPASRRNLLSSTFSIGGEGKTVLRWHPVLAAAVFAADATARLAAAGGRFSPRL